MFALKRQPLTVRAPLQGFTLIEALIAFAVLAVGVMGIVSLLLMSKTSQHQAVQRSRAVALADSIIERIRSNPSAVGTYSTYNTNGTIDTSNWTDPPSQPTPVCDNANPCTAIELANQDMWEWGRAMFGATVTAGGDNTGGLINPIGCIAFNPNPGSTNSGELTVRVQWRGLEDTFDAVQGGDTVCGSGDTAGNDTFRREVAVTTLIIDGTEF